MPDAISEQQALNRLAHHDTIVNGELAASTTARQMPNISAEMVTFKNVGDDGTAYIGGTSNLTVGQGTTNQTTGFPMGPNDPSMVLTVNNLNALWYRCSNPSAHIAYIVQKR